MPNTPQEIRDKVISLLDELVMPLSREDYREVLETLVSDMECRIDCLDEEEADED